MICQLELLDTTSLTSVLRVTHFSFEDETMVVHGSLDGALLLGSLRGERTQANQSMWRLFDTQKAIWCDPILFTEPIMTRA
jgi:hypothetical protein